MFKRYTHARAVLAAAIAVMLALSFGAACSGGGEGDVTPAPTTLRGTIPEVTLVKPDFVLTDTRGQPFDFKAETEGQVTLLYFGYTHCPDVCPTHMADLAAALQQMPEEADDVKVVFVSVDPARDTSERIGLWLGLFDETFIGLTGDEQAIADAGHAALGNMHKPTATYAYGDGEYTVSHPAVVIAYGTDGTARVLWPFGFRVADYVNDLQILLNEGDAS